MNGVSKTSRGEKKTFIVNSAGEYEVQNIFIKGLPSISKYLSQTNKINTIYTVNMENLNPVPLSDPPYHPTLFETANQTGLFVRHALARSR